MARTRKRKGRRTVRQASAAVKVQRVVGPRAENVRAVLYLKAHHLDELEELASEQARAIGARRSDLSKAARTVLDEWIARRR